MGHPPLPPRRPRKLIFYVRALIGNREAKKKRLSTRKKRRTGIKKRKKIKKKKK